MVLAEVGEIKEYIQLIALILSGIVIPVLVAVVGILYRHGKVSKETAEGLKSDLTDIQGIATATTKAIENQKVKNPDIAKELTTDVVSNVVSKEKLDSFLGKLGLNKTEEPVKSTEPGK